MRKKRMGKKSYLAMLCSLVLVFTSVPFSASAEVSGSNVVWSLDTNKMGTPGTTPDGEYLQGTDGMYQPGIQVADKSSSSMAMYNDGSLGINPSGGTHKAINIQTGTAVQGTDYYTNNGFVAEAGKMYTITFNAYVADGSGQVRVRGNKATDAAANGTWSTTDISKEPTPVSYTWTQKAAGGNMQIDTGSTAQGTIVYLTDLQITTPNEAPADTVVWSLDTSKMGTPGTTPDGEYLQGTDGMYQPGIQVADKNSSSMAMYDGGSLGINPSGGTYKAINIQTGTTVGGTNYYSNNGFIAKANKTYSVTFSVYVASDNGEVRVRGNQKTATNDDWKSTSIGVTPTPVTYTWTQSATGGNLQIDTGSTAQGIIVYLTDLQITTSVGGSTTPTTPSDEVVVAYDLQEDTGLVDIMTNGGTNYLARAGGPTLTPISNADGSVALEISNRVESWNGVDVKAAALGLAKDAEYSVELVGHIPDGVTIPSGAKIVLGLASGTYDTLTSVDATSAFTLSYAGVWDSGTGLRIQDSAGIADFVIDSLIIKVKGGIEMPLKPLPTVPGVVIAVSGQNGAQYTGATIVLGTDNKVWPFATNSQDDDPVVAFVPEKNATYHLTFNVTSNGVSGFRVRWYNDVGYDPHTDADAAHVNDNVYKADEVATKVPAYFQSTIAKDETKDYAVDFRMSGSEVAGGLVGNIGIRGQSGNNDFTINNLKITDDSGNVLVKWSNTAAPFVPDDYIWPESKWDLTLPSLKDAYSKYFLIGNILGWGGNADATPWGQENDQADKALKDASIISQTEAMFKAQYNVVTPENIMKPENISKAKDTYDYTLADKLIAWAKVNNIAVHGHTLVWHQQSPAWLNKGDAANRASAKANLESYIADVAGHFKGQVISWDVVNEAFSDTTKNFDGSDWTTGLRKDSPWYIAYANGADASKGESGADYIYDAFVAARLADPNATLYYNDYNETYKYEQIAQMAEALNAKWKADARYDGRLLVEGIGMQSHFWVGQDPDVDVTEVETTIQRFIQAGLRITVSELDIPFAGNNNYHLDEAKQAKQAELYGTLFGIYKKYADNIDRVTFWGKADIQSWRGSGMPVLFDNSYAPKAAFWTVIGLAAPTENSTISPATVTFYTNLQADVKVNVTLKGNTLSAIKKGDVALVEGKDYSVAAASTNGTQVVTIKKGYLATLSNNDVLTFVFSAGNTADLKIMVTRYTSTDTTPANGSGATMSSSSGADSGSTEHSGSTEQTPTPEKPLLNSKLVDAKQLKSAVQQALQANEPVNFSDVPATHWAAKAIQLASQLGIVKGEPNGEFKGSDNVTRAEFVEMIIRALGIDTTGEDSSFSDTDGHWAADYIRALHRAGIVNGTGNGAFNPDQEITRAEMAAILARILNMSAANGTKFSDINGNWAADYINQLSQAGIVNGVGDGKFAPKATATRDQSVAIIMRMLNIVLDLGLNL
ncbi:endo-1,4-beta-xylanase [Paenibacillus segetis]|uniref:Beta-xylanase n=1 Tax=Paenibacillus segetis TaxID=1325360 RepID=A0ABQ1YSW2_9BACL|nr:endo-1,4-beta-xylanase [Paenibacillus segetis]GGH35847.1 hypothetical protein GCM10008013_42400 [Paenibacillus segetis]